MTVNGFTATNLQNMKNDLNDIVRRIEKLEKATFGSREKSSKKKGVSNNDNLRGKVLNLRDANFFKQPKVALEVHAKLQSTYPCDLNRVEVILLRLSKNKLLRVTSKTIGCKKKKAYAW